MNFWGWYSLGCLLGPAVCTRLVREFYGFYGNYVSGCLGALGGSDKSRQQQQQQRGQEQEQEEPRQPNHHQQKIRPAWTIMNIHELTI